jgi:hypothetical protein
MGSGSNQSLRREQDSLYSCGFDWELVCGAVEGEIGWSEDAYDDMRREKDSWH